MLNTYYSKLHILVVVVPLSKTLLLYPLRVIHPSGDPRGVKWQFHRLVQSSRSPGHKELRRRGEIASKKTSFRAVSGEKDSNPHLPVPEPMVIRLAVLHHFFFEGVDLRIVLPVVWVRGVRTCGQFLNLHPSKRGIRFRSGLLKGHLKDWAGLIPPVWGLTFLL
ncbi:proline iminopeptidase [Striga asiatica]|uniref:Proline iminopeptidase n=1 Tax=Striga asiatica TaxID=4170 RepID=A0A5A7Q2J8_STRAF|nr:proline iminopeptidase [Striga asiatica]